MVRFYLVTLAYVTLVINIARILDALETEHTKNRRFSLREFREAVGNLPGVQPLVQAGFSRCESLKNILGITYEQMQGKNINFHELLGVDIITKNGNKKFNITSMSKIHSQLTDSGTVYILIHGYLGSSDGSMVSGLSSELLKLPKSTVVALDVSSVFGLEYFRTTTYAMFIGEKLGDLLVDFVENGKNNSNIHLIGHSLGAHIAGIAGQRVSKVTGSMIGRITGLDPAGPCFSNADVDVRLDRTDGQYVDVIHTNAGILGMKEPVGHIDFYPNGGLSQTGCYLLTCDHSRSWELYAEAISAPDHFPARLCDSWTRFNEGECSKNEVVYMRLDVSPDNEGTYFFKTSSSSPFGLGAAGTGK